MPVGCTNPAAANYDPAADIEDYSCVYLNKVGNTCFQFEDVQPDQIVDESFTVSFSVEGENYVFFHDYIPDFYFSTREKLHALKDNKIYHLNEGPMGVYFNPTPKPFFMDIVFRSQEEMTLNAISWVTEMYNALGAIIENRTFTHITIWNGYQCTGRIPLADTTELLGYNSKRKTMAQWSFNNFRNQLIERGGSFILDLFNNFAVDTSALGVKPWYNQDLMEDNYFIIRLELDNLENLKLVYHESDIDANKSFR